MRPEQRQEEGVPTRLTRTGRRSSQNLRPGRYGPGRWRPDVIAKWRGVWGECDVRKYCIATRTWPILKQLKKRCWSLGKSLKEIAHGSTEEEAKRHVDSERLKEKAKEEVRAKMEVNQHSKLHKK